jgi:hypothetical protein
MTARVSRLYTVGRVTQLDQLEPGLVMYEICLNKPSKHGGLIGAGFVFDPGRGERDYRDVDGSVMRRFTSSSPVKGDRKADRELTLDGFDQAVANYPETRKP